MFGQVNSSFASNIYTSLCCWEHYIAFFRGSICSLKLFSWHSSPFSFRHFTCSSPTLRYLSNCARRLVHTWWVSCYEMFALRRASGWAGYRSSYECWSCTWWCPIPHRPTRIGNQTNITALFLLESGLVSPQLLLFFLGHGGWSFLLLFPWNHFNQRTCGLFYNWKNAWRLVHTVSRFMEKFASMLLSLDSHHRDIDASGSVLLFLVACCLYNSDSRSLKRRPDCRIRMIGRHQLCGWTTKVAWIKCTVTLLSSDWALSPLCCDLRRSYYFCNSAFLQRFEALVEGASRCDS